MVSRLGADAAVVPSAMCVSATGEPRNAYLAGLITGRELSALGVNFDLAPVMDVNSNPHNPVIGVRSYGDAPETVSRYGVEMIRGLTEGGVLSCAKHFPGHGDTALDSHLSLPRVDKTLEELESCELAPFRAAIEAGVPAVMTTHILFPELEPDGVPATMSRRIITGILKERMGFKGLVVSDCMMMQAIQTYYGTVNGIVAGGLRGRGFDVYLPQHRLCAPGLRGAESGRGERTAAHGGDGSLRGEDHTLQAGAEASDLGRGCRGGLPRAPRNGAAHHGAGRGACLRHAAAAGG